MARIYLRLHIQTVSILSSHILTSLLVLAAIISVFSVLAFLCGSHKSATRNNKGKTEQLGEKRVVEKLHSSISSKALMVANKMISWKKVEDEGEKGHYDDGVDDETAIWKKGIIKGEKCRPLEFSGKILYDADGNQIPDSPQQAQG